MIIPSDICLIGFTGTGKSTLMGKLTQTVTKISENPYNTLQPIIGVIKFIDDRKMNILDLPSFKKTNVPFIDKY